MGVANLSCEALCFINPRTVRIGFKSICDKSTPANACRPHVLRLPIFTLQLPQSLLRKKRQTDLAYCRTRGRRLDRRLGPCDDQHMTAAHTQTFMTALRHHKPTYKPTRWLFISYDQLNGDLGPLADGPGNGLGVLMIENRWKGARRPYHPQKLALVVANMRHFALEQAERGFAVRYEHANAPYGEVLAALRQTLGSITCMLPAEYEMRQDIAPHVQFVPHTGWLSSREDFESAGGPPWRMDRFYRRMRQKTGYLMAQGTPEGGRFSLDEDNRKPYKGEPPAPTPLSFEPDAITDEAVAWVQQHYPGHYGAIDATRLPATARDAAALWRWAQNHCLTHFGTFEDAMARLSPGLFHTHVSQLINLHRLLPAQVVSDALASQAPLNSKEGFLRQILGWREFVFHVHLATGGLRNVPTRNFFDAHCPLPKAYWERKSGLSCLDHVVADVWREGYSHHITRLMILSNIATLLQCDPRELTDWFWVAYVDAYDWVVEPNVLGMGTFALGDLMMTKPYICGAAYINRMSDYCKSCAFHPTKNCPITPMYWAHLRMHAGKLTHNHRMKIPLMGLKKRSPEKQAHDANVLAWAQKTLTAGQPLRPDDLPA